jgi:N-ethylmaleimide reductase
MTVPKLFTPTRIGDLELPNRIVMAPLTRNRARADGDVPHALNAEYYAQRATAGLLISEGTQISPEGKGEKRTPGIHSPEQVAGWRLVTDAVHKAGGRIAAQLWHVGRISHAVLQPGRAAPVGPSAIVAENSRVYDGEGFIPVSAPRALETAELPRLIGDYAQAARNAKDAGFDAVEIHAANGYLLHQFLADRTNQRTDAYGGPIANRARLLLEVAEAVAEVWTPGRVGVRLSPFSSFGDIADGDPMATFGHAIEGLSGLGIGFLHLVEGQTGGTRELPPGADLQMLRRLFKGSYIGNNGYDRGLAIEAVESGRADLVAFGKLFIANPDLVERLRRDAPLNTPDQATFYGGDTRGYTDYPALEKAAA